MADQGQRSRRKEPPPYRLPVTDDAHDRSERKKLWAWIDTKRSGWVPLKELVGRLVEVMTDRGVQALSGHTPEAYRAKTMFGRAAAGGKAAIQLWRNTQEALLKAPDAGMGRLGLLAVEGGPEFARVLLCVNQYIALQSMFRALDDGDRMVTRDEFQSGSRGRVFWSQLTAFMKDAVVPLGSREGAFDEINKVHAGTRAEDDAITFDELASWAMMRLIPPLAHDDDLGPMPESILRMSVDKREEMQREGGTAWLGPVGQTVDSGLRPPRAKRYDHTSYISADPAAAPTDGDDARARALVAGVGHNTAKYVTPSHGFGKYTERHPIFATEASQSMSTFDGPGLSRAFEGEWATFTIVTRDSRMRNTTLGEPEIQVKGPAEVGYKILAYSEIMARKLGHRHGKGGPGVFVCQWRASVAGDYVLKARLTSHVGLPLFVKKVTVKAAPTDGSLAALRGAAVADLRVILSAEAQRQAERELGRVRQWRLRSNSDWLRAHQKAIDAAQSVGAAPGSPARSPTRKSSAGRSPDDPEAEAAVREAERSVVVWRLSLSSSRSSLPDPKRIANCLALPKATHVEASIPDADTSPTSVQIAFHLENDETAESLAALLRACTPASAARAIGVEVTSLNPPLVKRRFVFEAERAGGDAAGAGDETMRRVARLLTAREKLEEEAVERNEVGETHDLNFTALLSSGSKVVMGSAGEAMRSASATSEHNRLEAAVLAWQESGTVATAEEVYNDKTKRSEVQRPKGQVLVQHKGKLYFCAEPLHYVLADFSDPSKGAPRLKAAGALGFPEWSFERDAWQVVAREPSGQSDPHHGRPRSSRRPKSAPPPWQPAYPKTPTGKHSRNNGRAQEVSLDTFKQRAVATIALGGEVGGANNISNLG